MDEHEEPTRWPAPVKWIVGIFLVLLLVVFLVPIAAIQLDPGPKNIPSYSDFSEQFGPVPSRISSSLTDSVVTSSKIKQVTDKIVTTSCSEYSKVCYAKALFSFVQNEFTYVPDPTTIEYIKTAEESFYAGGGDCDDGSVALVTMLRSVGIPARFVLVPRHVYVEAYLPEAIRTYRSADGWVPLDVTCEYCGFGQVARDYLDSEVSYVD